MADRNTLQQMASASYKTSAPSSINGWTLVSQTPTLKFYKNGYNIVVAIRGTQPSDPQDLQADALIATGSLPSSSRFQNDLNTLRQFQIIYPSPPFQYSGVGHSLGGAILDEFLKSGALASGLSYNPAIQPGDFQAPINNQRIYLESDPLYQLMGRHARVAEVRKSKGASIWGRLLKQVPYIGKLYDAYSSHQLDNFVGGTHREDWLKKHKLDPSTRYSLAQLSKVSGVPKAILQEVYNRGIGAYKTQPTSVRLKGSYVKNVDAPMSKKLSKEQWAWARVYSFLDGNPKHDNDLRANKAKVGRGLKGGAISRTFYDTLMDIYSRNAPNMTDELHMAYTNASPADQDDIDNLYQSSEGIESFPEVIDMTLANQPRGDASGLIEESPRETQRLHLMEVLRQDTPTRPSTPTAEVGMLGLPLDGSGGGYERSASYLKEARRRAKATGYDPAKVEFANDGVHKLQLTTPEGKVVRFGRVGYGDHLIWLHREKQGQTPKGTAQKKRDTFRKSHLAMGGNWKSDKYSPNWLAIRILW